MIKFKRFDIITSKLDIDSKEYHILKSLSEIKVSFDKKKEMTKAIKIALVKLGHFFKFKVYARTYTEEFWNNIENIFKIESEIEIKKEKFRNKEWLYDVHWYTDIDNFEDDEKKYFMPKTFELACECEWSKNEGKNWSQNFKDIGYDFQKLLFSNSKIKLFICRAHNEEQLEKLNTYFYNSICKYENLKDRSKFLLVCFNNGSLNYFTQLIK